MMSTNLFLKRPGVCRLPYQRVLKWEFGAVQKWRDGHEYAPGPRRPTETSLVNLRHHVQPFLARQAFVNAPFVPRLIKRLNHFQPHGHAASRAGCMGCWSRRD